MTFSNVPSTLWETYLDYIDCSFHMALRVWGLTFDMSGPRRPQAGVGPLDGKARHRSRGETPIGGESDGR